MLRQLTALAALLATANAWLPDESPKARMTSRGLELVPAAEQVNATEFEEAAIVNARNGKHRRWTPGRVPLRGVNLGSLFVYEPWLAEPEWKDASRMDCGDSKSEFDCVIRHGQTKANQKFQQHWQDFIPESEFDLMVAAGINTVRIPIGYWMYDAIIEPNSERFPRGGLEHLKRICGYASDRGFYIFLELHGAPGAQKAQEAFTGQYAPTPGFYNDYNYGRATQFLSWLTEVVHRTGEGSDDRMRNVGAIGVVNEPLSWENQVDSLRRKFYPDAYNAIRAKESQLGIPRNDALHVGFMNTLWGSGNPKEFLPSGAFSTIFEDHRYVKFDPSVPKTHDDYIRDACTNDRSSPGEDPTVVTEWSISPPDENTSYWDRSDANKAFFQKWFRAAVIGYERFTLGWTFWTWKYQSDDWRWSYKGALDAGVIPWDLNTVASSGACNGYI
ncbi:glycoside hydrolase superfamily [Microdochium trichocladiopsis]|uniref:glucan endo-1,6-beta-glucosidase n=1 Tax=Microdochium trichocladiopsis TaxID=1682393 RepID=A0A9P9BY57_9PEZI|nr:glycoside hydrolase superfamily [Microdochium trichocladiopsis]KAH7037723.1 glycoside hydrolase superfamily [Microdochium trichocladiopsis]